MDVHEKLTHEILKALALTADELHENHADLWTTEKEIVVAAPRPMPNGREVDVQFHERLVALPIFLRHELDAVNRTRSHYYFELPFSAEVARCAALTAFEIALAREEEREMLRMASCRD